MQVIDAACESHEEEGEVSLAITCTALVLSLCPKQVGRGLASKGTIKGGGDTAGQRQGKSSRCASTAVRDACGGQDEKIVMNQRERDLAAAQAVRDLPHCTR